MPRYSAASFTDMGTWVSTAFALFTLRCSLSRLFKPITSSRSWVTTSGRSLNVITVFSICVLASFVRLGAKDWNDTAVNTSTKGHCKIIPE
ncbi:hypothetical protein NXW10_02115 [Bacteroides fragilis]|nr:hypothetical protein NXW10_02115 [Bacteroides fragilis]